jgi:hypothetical protein
MIRSMSMKKKNARGNTFRGRFNFSLNYEVAVRAWS